MAIIETPYQKHLFETKYKAMYPDVVYGEQISGLTIETYHVCNKCTIYGIIQGNIALAALLRIEDTAKNAALGLFDCNFHVIEMRVPLVYAAALIVKITALGIECSYYPCSEYPNVQILRFTTKIEMVEKYWIDSILCSNPIITKEAFNIIQLVYNETIEFWKTFNTIYDKAQLNSELRDKYFEDLDMLQGETLEFLKKYLESLTKP